MTSTARLRSPVSNGPCASLSTEVISSSCLAMSVRSAFGFLSFSKRYAIQLCNLTTNGYISEGLHRCLITKKLLQSDSYPAMIINHISHQRLSDLAKLKRSRGLTTVATFFASGNQCPELNLKRTLWGLKAKNRIFPSQAQGQSTTLVALINEVIPQFEFLFSVSNKVNTRRIALSG